MMRPKTYKVQVTENTDGTMTVDHALVLDKVNQHTRRWRPVDKRKFASSKMNKATKFATK